MASRLTEANYLSRRVKLRDHLAAAERAHSDAGFRREMEDATDVEVKAARDVVSTLTDRIAALDAAWERTKQEVQTERVEAERNAREASLAVITGHANARKALAAPIEAAALKLAALYSEYRAIGDAIIEEVRPHGALLGRDQFANLRDAVNGGHNPAFADPAILIGGILFAGGLPAMTVSGGAALALADKDLQTFIDQRNDKVVSHAQALTEEFD